MILVLTNKVEKMKYFSTLLGLIFIEITRSPFETLIKIGHCVFVKIYILDQNSAGGRFLRFVASFVSHAILKFTAVKTIT